MNRARRTYPRSRTPWSRWWPEHRSFLEIRARATTLWEKALRGCDARDARAVRSPPRTLRDRDRSARLPECPPPRVRRSRVPRRVRVCLAARPPARVTSKKTPRRVRNRAFAVRHERLDSRTVNRPGAGRVERRKAFRGGRNVSNASFFIFLGLERRRRRVARSKGRGAGGAPHGAPPRLRSGGFTNERAKECSISSGLKNALSSHMDGVCD